MENIDIAATVELLLGIAILYFIAKSLLKSRSEKTVIGHVETAAPYKVETPAPIPETVDVEVTEVATTPAKPKRAPAKKAPAKKPAAKKTVAKKKA
jgi:hypothetical protein